MRVVSVNVGRPKTVAWRGAALRTGIYKHAVTGPVRLRPHNLDGDGQANLDVHGGTLKAVYAYPAEAYAWWASRLGVASLPWGALGENLSVEGGAATEVFAGDRYRVGTAEVAVTQPRLPCHKLCARLERDDAEALFDELGEPGFYLSVAQPGVVEAGVELTLVDRLARTVSIAEMYALHMSDDPDPARLRFAAALTQLPDWWRERYRARLTRCS